MSDNRADSREGGTLPPIRQNVNVRAMSGREKFVPRNWKVVAAVDLKKMTPLQRSRYLAYEDPPKQISEAQDHTTKRLIELKKLQKMRNPPMFEEEVIEKNKHEKLIGQLKAAEARNRLRIMRLRYTSNRAQEVNHLISCQPSALKSVRLQALLPPYSDLENRNDNLDKLDRHRVECLLEDVQGLTTHRT